MKKNTFILSLLAISMLSGCTPPSPDISSAIEASSSVKEGPKDELIIAGMHDPKLESDDHVFYFRVPEFTERFNLVIGSSMSMLYYGDTRIGENLHYDPYIYASDINGDGYREIVFAHNEMRSDGFTVYDIKNAKTLFSQEDMTVEKFGHFGKYQYALDIREGELVFLPVLGHFMGPREFEERKIVDWGHLKWSEQKGCYFEWENIFSIKQIILEGVYEEDTNIKLLQDGYREEWWTIDAYSLEKGKNYLMKYKVLRDDYTRNLGNDFLEVEWSNENPSYLETCYPVENSCHPETGDYVTRFSVRDAYFEGARTWKWYFGSWGFEVNYHIMLGEASNYSNYVS